MFPSHRLQQSYRRQPERQGYTERVRLLSFGHPALTLRPATALWCLRNENELDCSTENISPADNLVSHKN